MALSVNFLGDPRAVPETDEEEWGGEVTDQLFDLLTAGDLFFFLLAGGTIVEKEARAASTLAAGATLTQTARAHEVEGSGGAVTLDGTTPIAAGETDGQRLRLVGAHATNTVTIAATGTAAGLNGNVTLGLHESIELVWDAGNAVWEEVSRSH